MSQPRGKLTLALAGAGLVGRRHASLCPSAAGVSLKWIADPTAEAKAFADEIGARWFPSLPQLLSEAEPDGVIIATPNQLHLENGLSCVEAEVPILIEKPIAATAEDALTLIEASEQRGVPLLVGHHRRHNPLIQQARTLIDEGHLGRIVSLQASCWLSKPESYFQQAWRVQQGGGPILVNAIHDIDILRRLCGEVRQVQARTSSAIRGGATEDSAVVLMTFESGALGTLNISDTIAAPWSWELTAAENPAYPPTSESCYRIGGTEASLSIPDMRLWSHGPGGHWKTAIQARSLPGPRAEPLIRQLEHFTAVIRGDAEPLVSGRDALGSLETTLAILQSAERGQAITLR